MVVVAITACGGGSSDTAQTDASASALAGTTVSNWIDFAAEGDTSVSYTGVVRYGYALSWVTKTVGAEGVFDCNAYFLGIPGVSGTAAIDPAPGFTKSCQKQVFAANVVQTGTMPVVNVPLIQPAYKGYTTARVQSGGDTGNPNQDTGAFREPCTPSHFAFDDPIVFPNQPGKSHLHLFFGNTGASAATTATNITTTGDSTCAGGTLNRTGYWVPAVIDIRTGAPLVPTEQLFYYKGGYLGVPMSSIKPFPAGLRMIAGSSTNTADSTDTSVVRIWCEGGDGTPRRYIPSCNKGEQLSFTVIFPQCWDGVNLDSPDHKSHMAYANNGCPSTHPVALPEVSLIVRYTVAESGTDTYLKLSSDNYSGVGGYSMHADWFNGWDTSILNEWVTNCINPSKDCHEVLLGDGRYLY